MFQAGGTGKVNKLKQVLIIGTQTYREWLFNSRNIIVLIVLFFLGNYTVAPMVNLSKQTGVPMNVFEPFIANMNSQFVVLMVLAAFLVLISDFPRMEGNNGYFLIRTSRVVWLAGKLLFALFAVFTYIAGLFLALTVRVLEVAFYSEGWSYLMRDYYTKYANLGYSNDTVCVVSDSLFNNYTAFEGFWYTVILLAAMLFMLCLIMMLANLINKKIIGIVTNLGLIVLGFVLAFSGSRIACILPVGNIMLSVQNTATHHIISVWYPFAYFAGFIVLLTALCVILVKKVIVQKDGER